MESLGAFLDGAEWDSLGKIFSTEELEFTPHILGQCSFPPEHNEELNLSPSDFFPTSEANISLEVGLNESLFHSLDSFNSNMHHAAQESSYSTSSDSSGVFTTSKPSQGINYHFNHSYQIPDISMNVCVTDENNTGSYMPGFTDIVMGETLCIKEDNGSPDSFVNSVDNIPAATAPVPAQNELQLKRKCDVSDQFCAGAREDKTINTDTSPQILKKKCRVARDVSTTIA